MKHNLQQAALFESVREMVEEIDSLFKEHGYDPTEYDEDELIGDDIDKDDTVMLAYSYVHKLKTTVEE